MSIPNALKISHQKIISFFIDYICNLIQRTVDIMPTVLNVDKCGALFDINGKKKDLESSSII